jgi:hypothetical protein
MLSNAKREVYSNSACILKKKKWQRSQVNKLMIQLKELEKQTKSKVRRMKKITKITRSTLETKTTQKINEIKTSYVCMYVRIYLSIYADD